MNATAMLATLRAYTGTDSSSYPEAQALEDLNIGYHDVEDRIVKRIGERYFWNHYDTPMTQGQSEYPYYSTSSGQLNGVSKTYGVSIDWKGDGNFTKAEPLDSSLDSKDQSWLVLNVSQSYPKYEIKDNSLFVYPAPKDGLAVLRHYVANGLSDIVAGTTSAQMFNGKIPEKHHYLVPMAAAQYGFLRRQLFNESINASNAYEAKISQDISKLNTRDVSAKTRQVPPGFAVNPYGN